MQEFTKRMSEDFAFELGTEDFLLAEHENGEEYLVCEKDETLVCLTLNTDQKIKGVGLVLTEGCDIATGIEAFAYACAVFTGTNIAEQRSTLSNCGITAEGIKYADSSLIITIGKYKYSVVCSEFGICLFCDRV